MRSIHLRTLGVAVTICTGPFRDIQVPQRAPFFIVVPTGSSPAEGLWVVGRRDASLCVCLCVRACVPCATPASLCDPVLQLTLNTNANHSPPPLT